MIQSLGVSEELQASAEPRDFKREFVLGISNGEEMNTLEPHLSVASAIEQMAEAHEQIESGCTVGKALVRRKYCPHEVVSIH